MRQVARRESDGILGAMRQVALAGGRPLSHADTVSVLAAAHYLFTIDRVDEALGALARVDRALISTHLQHDYLAAYAATLEGDLARARSLAAPWASHPVDRWRKRFEALLAMLDEAGGGPSRAAAAVDRI